MRSSETVFGMLQDRGKRGLPIQDLYRQLYNPQLYLRAYARLYSNDGAMTKGTTHYSRTYNLITGEQRRARVLPLIEYECSWDLCDRESRRRRAFLLARFD